MVWGRHEATRGCPKANSTGTSRRKNENFIILPSCVTYKGRTRPRPVTPRSSSEWMPTSMAGTSVLPNQVHSYGVLLFSGPSFSQPDVFDLAVAVCHPP